MAWFALACTDNVDLYCSADPCVEHDRDDLEEPTMLTASECRPGEGATRYTVRPMTWIESQRWDGSTPAETIDGIVRLSLVMIDGDESKAEAAKKSLHPKVAVPLCVAIQQVTWGNFT